MSRTLVQPVGQKRLTNVAIVRLKKHGMRFEIACYKNKVLSWRSGDEKDLDEVLQSQTVYSNVSKGILAKTKDLKVAFGNDDQSKICLEILEKGELQVAGKERESQLSNQFRDIATIVMEKTVNPDTQRPYTISMIERLMHEIHFAVDPHNSSKKQALEVIRELQKHYPIKRAPMRLRLTIPEKDLSSLMEKLKGWNANVISQDLFSSDQLSVVCEIEPGYFRDCDALVKSFQGKLDMLFATVQYDENDAGHQYNDNSELPARLIEESSSNSSVSTVQLAERLKKQNLATETSSGEQPPKQNRCSTCDAIIGDAKQYREHFKTDWHPDTPTLLSFYTVVLLIVKNKNMDEADPVNVSDFQEIARKMLPKMYYDFFRGGAEGEFSLKENIKAFERILFRPRVLVDVRNINMSTNLLGYDIHSPILIAPTGSQKLAHPEGEVATARAAAACKALMVLSFSSSCTLEEVASCCDAVRFFQLYVFKNRDITERIVKRAECSGFKAIVLTVDTPRLGKREKDIKNKMIVPKVANYELLSADVSTNNGSGLEAFTYQNFDPSLTWQDVEWLKSKTTLPILLKGILTTDDARMAIKTGISGIIVSNHGARQLDYSPAPISVLEEIVKTVSGAIPVLMDGGIRRGTDVFKALALGANAVLVGRPVVFGLAANGEKGVQKVIQMLNDELELTMALAGCPTIKHISRNCVQTVGDKLRSSM